MPLKSELGRSILLVVFFLFLFFNPLKRERAELRPFDGVTGNNFQPDRSFCLQRCHCTAHSFREEKILVSFPVAPSFWDVLRSGREDIIPVGKEVDPEAREKGVNVLAEQTHVLN